MTDELVYIGEDAPGITRHRVGKGFRYVDAAGRRITDAQTLARIRALAIPPAYEHVWICADPRGHIQATGRDARGRKQYRYHEVWKRIRDADKYQQLEAFGTALARIRRKVARDLAGPTMTPERVIATVVRLLELTLIRVGTPRYAVANKSFGLTTMRRRHARVAGSTVRFKFRGKSGIEHDVTVRDRRIARLVKRCMEIPGQELFQYIDETGTVRRVESGLVNAYLKEAGGGDFTAKHYRTWAASVYAFSQLQRRSAAQERPLNKTVNEVLKETAARLGNTPKVCRDCYVHPAVISTYLEGKLPQRLAVKSPAGLRADEWRFLQFLRACELPPDPTVPEQKV